MKKYYIAIGILGVVCVATIAVYYATFANQVGDSVKAEDISSLSNSVTDYVSKYKKLPEALVDLNTQNPLKRRLSQYTYKKVGKVTSSYGVEQRYELCANFKSESTGSSRPFFDSSSDYQSYADATQHGAGTVCFKLYAPDYSSGSSTAPFDVAPPSPQATAPTAPAAANAELSACGKTDPKVTDVYSAGNIKIIDVKGQTVQIDKSGVTNYFNWNLEPQVFDSKCGAISVSTLKAGNRVTIYYSGDKRVVYFIKKLD